MPITTKTHDLRFSYPLTDEDLTQSLLPGSEVRCNKIMTIRVWEKQIVGKISELSPHSLYNMLQLVKEAF
jgi:hypothetical protein